MSRAMQLVRSGMATFRTELRDPELWCLCIIGTLIWLAP